MGSEITRRSRKQLLGRAALATAAALKLGASGSASASNFYVDIPDIQLTSSSVGLVSQPLGIPDTDLSIRREVQGVGNPTVITLTRTLPTTVALAGALSNNVLRLTDGEIIDGTRSYSANSNVKTIAQFNHINGTTNGEWGNGGAGDTGYVGFRTASGNFGWMRVTVDAGVQDDLGSFGVTVHDYAYNDAGEAMRAGEVPVPPTWALLVLGAAAFRLRGTKSTT